MQDDFLNNLFLAMDRLTYAQSTLNMSDPEVYNEGDTYDLSEMAKNGSHYPGKMFALCTWKNKAINCSDYFTLTITALGYCYTFNSPEFISRNGRLSVWRAGMSSALSLTLNVEQGEYYAQIGNSAGLKVSSD